jgi:hypothetical protein
MSNLHLLPPGVDVIDAEAPYPGGWAWRYSVSVEMPSAREELGAEETIEILASPTRGAGSRMEDHCKPVVSSAI